MIKWILSYRLLARKFCWKRGYLVMMFGMTIVLMSLVIGTNFQPQITGIMLFGLVSLLFLRFVFADAEISQNRTDALSELIDEPPFMIEGYAHHALGRIAEKVKNVGEARKQYGIAWSNYGVREAEMDLDRLQGNRAV